MCILPIINAIQFQSTVAACNLAFSTFRMTAIKN